MTRAQNVLGLVVAGQHVGVGHARHGDGLVALAAAGAGVGRAHEPRRKLVGQVALQHAAFDQGRFLGCRAFVVHVERAAAAGHGAVIHHGHFGAGHRLPDQPGEGRGLLAVEVGFEAVAHRLMQQDAGPAGPEDHFHFAGRGGQLRQVAGSLRARLRGPGVRALGAGELLETQRGRRRPPSLWW